MRRSLPLRSSVPQGGTRRKERSPVSLSQTQRLKRSARGPGGGIGVADDSEIQGEYITNLQQQIYFLELETKILRDRLSEPGPPKQTTGTDTRDELAYVEAAPLDDPINGLKKKYVEREKLHGKEIQAREKLLEEKDLEIRRLKNEIVGLHDDLDEFEQKQQVDGKAFEEQKTRLTQECVHLEKSIEDRDHKISRLEDELNKRDEKQKEVYEELSKEQTKVSEQLHTIDQLQKENGALKKTCDDLKSRLPPEEDEDGEHSPSKLEDLEKEHCELKKASREKDVLIKKFELDMESMKEEKERVSNEYQKLLAKDMEDTETIKRLESAKEMLHTKLEAALEDGKDAMEMKATMQSKIDELSEKLNETQKLLEEAHARVIAAESDARMSFEKMERMERDFEARDTSYYAPMDAENGRLREDRRLMLEKIGLLEKDLAEKTALRDELEDSMRQVRAENDQLRNRLQISEDMEEIKMKEFEKLMSTNLHVASTIEKMMGHMRQKGQSGSGSVGDEVQEEEKGDD